MDDSIMDDSVFSVAASDSDAFSPEKKQPVKAKAKAAPKKAAAPAKAKAAPKKMTQTTLKTSKAATKKRAKPDSDDENSDKDGSAPANHDDDSILADSPPNPKRPKKAPVPKKAGKPLAEVHNESFTVQETTNSPVAKSKKSVEDTYQKLTQLEHILKRPDTYIGSVERTEAKMWVYNSEQDRMEHREVSYVPGLYKIFDEILVNAADNKQNDKSMDEVRVTIDFEGGEISVKNNGRGIPIEIHAKEGIYVPELIFGHLLVSSNYNDKEEKVTGGRNGYGAKLCNVYSTEFSIETVDSRLGKKYKQTWTENMTKKGKASITAAKTQDYTKVTFKPDFAKFGMDGMDADFEALAKRRVYDMAGTCKGIKVYLNEKRVAVSSFKKYMEMYTKALKADNLVKEESTTDAQVILTDRPHERWEIGFAVSDGSFQQVSFVNSIATTSGGTHVNYIADQIVDKLAEIVKKKNKGGVNLKPAQIRNHIFLFVNCLITNPAFTSQTKEQMTTKVSQFGSKCSVSEAFLKAIAKTEAVNNIIHFAQQKADQLMKKSDGNRRTRMNHSKLTDANKAGTKDGHQCTLILTEGDSASLLALAGRAVVDPDRIGVFPLRGKLLNVRDASVDQITKNAEIQNIKKFMGLQHKKHYEDTRSLRYGHLMIMTDQDHDGSHIKGLLINFLEVQYPSLLKIPGFLQEFITPIVKAWKGDPKKPSKLKSFFTMPEYEAWKALPGNTTGWEHKYFKGLGTSTSTDGEVYFRDPDKHLKEFAPLQADEPALIDMAFSKKKADARKEWLRQFRPGTFLDMSQNQITYNDFINKELILFSVADNMRSIPSVIDGFKPGQRKVLYTCFRRNLKKDVKVVELAGSVSGLTAYAYGDTSLQQTITGLAQTFVGSNNVNTLEPSGNFGSRLQGGSDCASARYIYTRLTPFARKVFNTKDEPLLTYNLDDGNTIEPEMYIPVVPMILINGADGIGTGWSTSIPNYNPEDVVANLKARMTGDKDSMTPMAPWFRGFKGEVEDIGGERFKFSGIINQTGDNEVEITELPVRMWTQDFKDKLEEIIKAEKTPSFIKDYVEYNTPDKVHFIIKLDDKHMKVSVERGLEETFKLSKTMATTNLVAFDHQGRIHKYATPLDMMEEFYQIRLKTYEQRKAYMLNEMGLELEKLNNQARFIKMIIDGKLVVSKKKKAVLVAELQDKGFKPFPKISDARKKGEFEAAAEDAEEADGESAADAAATAAGANDYDYLLGMAIWSLTQERIDRLMKQVGNKEEEIDKLVKTTPKELWIEDLDEFLAEWRFQLEDEARRAKESLRAGRRASAKLRIGGKKGSKKRKAEGSDASDDDFEVSKAKKVAKPKPQSMLASYFDRNDKKPPAAKTLVNAFELAPVAPPPAKQLGLLPESASQSEAPSDVEKKPASRPAPKPMKTVKEVSDDEDDVFAAVAMESAATAKAPGRTARATSRKPVKYDLGSDDSLLTSDGEDMLGDVGNMVKGIGATSTGASRSLFTETASRPSSSSSHSHGKSLLSGRPSMVQADSDVDETDYKKLIESAHKPAARPVVDLEDSDDEQLVKRPAPKAKAAPAAAKPKAKAVPKKSASASAAAPVVAAPKSTVLSPAAKAYAAKQAKAQAQALLDDDDDLVPPAQPKFTKAAKPKAPTVAKGRKKAVVSDDEEEMDVDDIADDLLNDDDDEDESVVKPAARPSRRAAAAPKKSKYVADDFEDDSELRDFVDDGTEEEGDSGQFGSDSDE